MKNYNQAQFHKIKIFSRWNLLNLVLILFSFVNVMELFLPRIEEKSSFVRLPLQLLNLLISIIMFIAILVNGIKWKNNLIIRCVKLLIFIVFLYFGYYFLTADDFVISEIIPYVRFLTWLFAIIFFYNYLLKYGANKFFFKCYIFTFLITVTKQIFETALFESEKLNGGDTAAMPLLFIIPMSLLIYQNQLKSVIILFCSIMIVISLRRTAILTLLICLPFFYNYISSELKKSQLFLLVIISSVLLWNLWEIFGDLVLIRFNELFDGGEDGSYGSGRSSFYLIVWDNWLTGDQSILLGNGLTSVRHLFMKKASIDLDHAHNDLLEILYTFGIVGLIIWLAFVKAFWSLRKRIALVSPLNVNIFYLVFVSFMIISISSGCILRISTVSMSICISLLMYYASEKYNRSC